MTKAAALIIALTACAAQPVDIAVKVRITPAVPGDDVQLFFGTVPRVNPLSVTPPSGTAISNAPAYAADQLGPHIVANVHDGLVINVADDAHALNAIIALEANGAYAAAVVLDNPSGDKPYPLVLEKVGRSSGIDASAWGSKLSPTTQCAHYRDSSLEALIVVDFATAQASGVAPYADKDCDGYPEQSADECDDTYWNFSGTATQDDAGCIGLYTPANGPECLVITATCTDGEPLMCPAAADSTNITNFCVPTRYCTDGDSDLKDVANGPSSADGEIDCPIMVVAGFPCATTKAIVMPSDTAGLVGCTTTVPIMIGLGADGPPYLSTVAVPGTGGAALITATQETTNGCSVDLTASGDWSSFPSPSRVDGALLELTAMGDRTLLMPLVLLVTAVPTEDDCPVSAQCSLVSPNGDSGLMSCLAGD